MSDEALPEVRSLSWQEGKELFDRQSRKYLGLSGEEFAQRLLDHNLEGLPHGDVIRILMLLPFWEEAQAMEKLSVTHTIDEGVDP